MEQPSSSSSKAAPQAPQAGTSSSSGQRTAHDNGSKEQLQQAQAKQQPQPHPTFIAAASWDGARAGYVFTTGDHGTGYYADSPQRQKPVPAAKGRPVALKSSSFAVRGRKLPAAGGGQQQQDAKKRKTDAPLPKYLAELQRWNEVNCSSDTQHDRPLVK